MDGWITVVTRNVPENKKQKREDENKTARSTKKKKTPTNQLAKPMAQLRTQTNRNANGQKKKKKNKTKPAQQALILPPSTPHKHSKPAKHSHQEPHHPRRISTGPKPRTKLHRQRDIKRRTRESGAGVCVGRRVRVGDCYLC